MSPMPCDDADEIAAALRRAGDPETAAGQRRYLKSDLEHLGVKLPELRALLRPYIRSLGKDDHARRQLLTTAGCLWLEPVFDQRLAAAILFQRRQDLLTPDDLAVLEDYLRDSHTWALVDTLTPHPVGRLLQREPVPVGAVLDRWAADEDFWIRRAALLAHLIPLKEGDREWPRFSRYADAMAEEREFFIRKAIGWVLRDYSRRRPDLVYEWVAPRTDRLSGVTMREAVKRLPAAQADALMAAYQQGRPAV
ncbi:MAG: DNA alkylation repair protein [Actinobacteria bacterium]|nr:DNA alkylation repair protein [Actinomycetota bacterium]